MLTLSNLQENINYKDKTTLLQWPAKPLQ